MHQNYYFDLYETLIDIKTDESKMEIWEKLVLFFGYYGANYTQEELKERYEKALNKLSKLNENKEHPAFEIEDVFYKLFKDKDIKPKKKYTKSATRVFRMLSTESIKLNPGVLELLENIKAQGKKVYVVSNGQSVFGLAEMKVLGINHFVDGAFFASDYGIAMPDAEFYNKVKEETEMKPKKSILISNNYNEVIVGAQELGMDTLLINVNDLEGVRVTHQVNEANFAKISELIL